MCDHARISKCKNIIGKGYTPNYSKAVFWIKAVKDAETSTYVIKNVYGKTVTRIFCKQELHKKQQQVFKKSKKFGKKGNEFPVKWKGCDNSLNGRIGKKDIVWDLW